MSFILIIISCLVLLDLIWWRAVVRLLRRARWKTGAWIAHTLFIVLQLAGLVVVILSRRADLAFELPRIGTAAVYVWHLLVLPVLAPLILIGGVVAGVIALIKGPKREPLARQVHIRPLSQEPVMNRRNFLGTVAALTPPLLSLSLTGIAMRQLESFRVRRLTIPIMDLPPALDGATIAHVSDIHVGRFTTGEVLRTMTAAVNDLRADIILMTGDLINSSLDELPEAVATVRQFSAPAGVYTIEGNHDLFDGREEFEQRVKASGLALLVNETADVTVRGHPVNLLGLRWGAPGVTGARPRYSDDGSRASLSQLLAIRNPDAFPILLAHHPHAFDHALDAGLPLTLAGHTHGGQLMLNEETGFGPMMFRYWSGHYTRADGHLVVSNGVGNWFPLRTSAPAEIIHLTLRRA
jgi:predicted MPP superfamily phosphohydrolase